MPRKYEKIRDACKRKGGGDRQCKAKAARIYNSQRKRGQKPVTRKSK